MTPEKRRWTLERLREINAERRRPDGGRGGGGPTFRGKPVPTGRSD
jgi:hypothetical protein